MLKRKPMPKWTADEDARLRELYGTMPVKEVARQLGRTKMAVATRASDMKLDGKPLRWSLAEKTLLAQLYPVTPMADLCRLMNRPKDQVRAMAKKLGLERPAEVRLASNQRLPLGAERRNSRGDLMRKVKASGPRAEAWKRVEVATWEEAHGPVPAGMIVTASDPAQPLTLANLMLVTRTDLANRNRLDQRYPPEVQQVIRLKSLITRQINRMASKAESEKSEAI
ncbi:HNH endonuclease [Xenophilus sp. Marseille-Q4582]|uniref:HNH endonuclease n=1 Tax=Xenophilus sp. Marseille-Q4582 TaxID=2866600 RepID=UPI001CE45D98|nr:HNH endonuclease [Xenophilus sp. Marseille-Q4582]